MAKDGATGAAERWFKPYDRRARRTRIGILSAYADQRVYICTGQRHDHVLRRVHHGAIVDYLPRPSQKIAVGLGGFHADSEGGGARAASGRRGHRIGGSGRAKGRQ